MIFDKQLEDLEVVSCTSFLMTAFSIRFDFEKPQWVPSRQRSICEAATGSIAAWANLDLSRDPAPSGASLLSTTNPPFLAS